MIGIPYLYVFHRVNHKKIKLEDLCSENCSVDIFKKKRYFEVMCPLPKANLDSKERDVIVLPLKLKKSIGRSKKNRQKEKGEDQPDIAKKRSSTLLCNICRQYRYNFRICQQDSAEKIAGNSIVR